MTWSIYKITGSLFKRAIGYSYQLVVWESIKVPTAKMEPEKITNMVGIFLTRAVMVSKYLPQKWNWKRLPIRWEPF